MQQETGHNEFVDAHQNLQLTFNKCLLQTRVLANTAINMQKVRFNKAS